MDDRMKELIAVGASVAANCQPCLEYHAAKAGELGACDSDVREAIEMGRLVRKGAAAKMDKFVLHLGEKRPGGAAADEECGCGG